MERVIYKFPFHFDVGLVTVRMPANAMILDVAMQGPIPCVWAIVDPGQESVEYHFRTFGTGQAVPKAVLNQIQTGYGTRWHLRQGSFEWWVFRVDPGPSV